MGQVTYELRTSRNARALAFDSLPRAQDELRRVRKTHGAGWRLVEVTLVERELDA